MLDFLPEHILNGLKNLNIHYVYELRLRANFPVFVNYQGKYAYLGAYGIVKQANFALQCTADEIADCVYRAGKYSVYSIEEQMKSGFITADCGERIGLAGEYVFEKGQPLALRNFTSLCIRVPHAILDCGLEIYQSCMCDKVRSVLIMSPPGLGKTTILRDLARLLSEKTLKNILICDERGEIAVEKFGKTCDVMKFADKATAFEMGIRAMRPEIIITDELSIADCAAVEKAVSAGIIVLASAHFAAYERLPKAFLGVFERYVLLSENALGKIKRIYNDKGKELY